MAVTLTERAAQEFKKICDEQKFDPETNLRVGIAAGGCSGFSYQLVPDKSVDEANDKLFDFFGVKLIVDKKSALYLDGTIIDFYEGLDKRGFTFHNPNAVKSCGCGSSFQV